MKRNLVYVVGLGPGDPQFLTAQAKTALENADVLCGYTVYIDLIRSFYPEKEVHATGMTKEIDRCRWALETAQSGKTVALVCSGDAGVYGMASPILELAPNYPSVEIEVIPGLTAALSGGAVLGAPLVHDFCVISLSDRLTPWEISAWQSTTRPRKDGPIIYSVPSAFCSKTANRRRSSAASYATLAERGSKVRS